MAGTLEALLEVLAIDEIHNIIGCTVLIEQVIHPDNMHVMEFTQAQCLLSELLQLRIEFFGLSCIAHPDAAAVAAAFRDILHKELLDGIGLIEKDVSCHVGVAEAAT